MISGFNTDVEHNGVVYHIQTEDKGLASELIVSLVYNKGTILASKRTPYGDLINGGLDEAALAERLSRQHKLMCAAIGAGRLADLQRMTAMARESASRPAVVTEHEPQHEIPPAIPDITVTTPAYTAPITVETSVPPAQPVIAAPIERPYVPAFQAPVETPMPVAEPTLPTIEFDELPIFDAVTIIDELELLPDEAVAVVSEFSGAERPKNARLSLDLLGNPKFKGGDRVTINIMVCRGSERKVIDGAQIMVKVLGSAFRPVIFHARSDSNGLAKVHLQLPHFQAGRAAMLIRAISDGEEIELRRIVAPG